MACKISDGDLIDLLRGLRSGAVDNRFVHRVDVCSAAPEALVADLQPAPGTDLTQDGYNSVWYFYCEKRFKNTQGKPSGHRQRAIAGGDNTCWHAETRPKDVEGSQGGTFCNLSYGCKKKQGSQGRSFVRLGWCMTEYDDTQQMQMQMQHGGAGDNNYVLCKVYRSSSSLAKGKSKSSASSSSSSKNATSSSKRKASGDHAEARPNKMIYEQMMQQRDNNIFSNNYPMPCDQESMINPMIADVGCGVQQQYVEEQQQMQHQDTIFSEDYPMACYPGMINPMFSDMGCGVQQQYVEQEQQLLQQQQYVEQEQQLLQQQQYVEEKQQYVEEQQQQYVEEEQQQYVEEKQQYVEEQQQLMQQQQQQQQPISAEEMQQQGSEFVETEYGLLPSAVAETNVEDWINCPEMFEGQQDQELQQQSGETPAVVTQEANVTEGETTTAGGEELAFVVQEEQGTQMQQQQPSAEEDPIADVIQYLKTTSTWLWPDSPSTCQASAAAMLYQQQEGSHYWRMQPQQHPSFPMG